FGADDTATAVGGINRYADIHGSLCLVLGTLFLGTPSKYQAPSTKHNPQKLRQATLAIACLCLNLTYLLRGGQVRAGVYACPGILAMKSATSDQLMYKKDLAL